MLDQLREIGIRPEFVYRHEWRQNDLAMRDNRCGLQRGRPWDAARRARITIRATVAGDGPTA